jgi:apolipoprotein N-acyltransferase
MRADELNYRFVMDQAARGDFALLFGSIEYDPAREATFNTAKLLTDRGQTEATYRKMHLVPYGEYLPMRPVLEPIAGGLVPGDFAAGDEATVFELPRSRVKIAALVCFEDTLGDLARRFALNGAQLLVNLTNDGWFLQSAGAEQHLDNAILRAVENRRPLVRCANTGVTCSIDRNGRIDRTGRTGIWIAPLVRGFVAREIAVPAHPAQTFYTRHGDWLAHFSAGIALVAVIHSRIRARVRPPKE